MVKPSEGLYLQVAPQVNAFHLNPSHLPLSMSAIISIAYTLIALFNDFIKPKAIETPWVMWTLTHIYGLKRYWTKIPWK